MTPSRILPDLQCSLLCEDVRQEASGNFILLGVVDVARVPQLPIRAFKLHVFNRWTAGVGTFSESVRMLAPDQTTVLAKSEMKFQMTNPATNATTVTLFTNVEFATPGTYFIASMVRVAPTSPMSSAVMTDRFCEESKTAVRTLPPEVDSAGA